MKLNKVTKALATIVLDRMSAYAKLLLTDNPNPLRISFRSGGLDINFQVDKTQLCVWFFDDKTPYELVMNGVVKKSVPAKLMVQCVSQLITNWSMIKLSMEEQAWGEADGLEVFSRFRAL